MTKDLQKVKDLLLLRKCSDRTVSNYLSCINRFKNYYKRKDLEKLNEDDILEYLKKNFINIGCSAATINVNRAAIKYYYLVNFNKEFSNVLLPQAKISSRFPKIISKQDFIKMFNSEFNLKHKIWIMLAYGSGLRISDVASLKVSDILSKEHKIRVIGKGNKERYAPLPNFTLKLLRLYWIQKESSYLLDSRYFHIITTVPYELNEIFLYNQKICYNILFKATPSSILELSEDPKWVGAKVGITSILHTWGQTMEFHPHIHSIVTGGGLKNNHWVKCNKDYLFKVQVLGSLFRGKFLYYLKHEFDKLNTKFNDLKSFNKFLEPLYNKTWITYIEPPKGNVENVIEYVGRYSFRVAISNERIKNIEDDKMTFEYKDYKDNSKIKEMTISCEEFIRRFLLHVLPDNFNKIKHYGLLSNRNKKNNIRLCRLLISRILNNEFVSTISRKLHKLKCKKCGSTNFSYSFQYDIHRLSI